MLKNKKIAWTATIFWMTVIFILSHQPATVSSGLSSGITQLIIDSISGVFPGINAQIEDFHTLVRKNAHFIAYFILGILLVNACKKTVFPSFKDIYFSFSIAVLYAASDEFHQLFIEGRSGEFRDVLIDSMGAITGILVYWAIHIYGEAKRNRIRDKQTPPAK